MNLNIFKALLILGVFSVEADIHLQQPEHSEPGPSFSINIHRSPSIVSSSDSSESPTPPPTPPPHSHIGQQSPSESLLINDRRTFFVNGIMYYCFENQFICNENGTDVDHFMCDNNLHYWGINFNTGLAFNERLIFMDDSLKDLILNLHNELRNVHAGSFNAARTTEMVYNVELAFLAEFDATNYDSQIDPCMKTKLFIRPGRLTAQALKPYDGIRFANVKDFFTLSFREWDLDENDRKQLLFGISYAVGCAIVRNIISRSQTIQYFYHITCIYAAKPIENEPYFEVADSPCKKCKSERSKKFKLLCSAEEKTHIHQDYNHFYRERFGDYSPSVVEEWRKFQQGHNRHHDSTPSLPLHRPASPKPILATPYVASPLSYLDD